MGSVYVELTITNRLDAGLAERGMLSLDDVRSVTLDHVLVDTGASGLALPQEVVDRLGLPARREVPIRTAAGESTAWLYADAMLTIEGRSDTFSCIALPYGSQALLGCVTMEALGLQPDIRNHRLLLLPELPGDTHWLV